MVATPKFNEAKKMSGRYPNLFSPGRIGTMEVRNRAVMAAMGTAYALPDGTASERWLKYLEARAKVEVGLIITEVTAVSPEGRGIANELRYTTTGSSPGSGSWPGGPIPTGPR